MHIWVFLLFSLNQGGLSASVVIQNDNSKESSYRVTQDFIFQSTPNHDLLYNPEVIQIVKKIDLTLLSEVTNLLLQLLRRYESGCDQVDELNYNITQSSSFVKVPEPGISVIKAVNVCKQMGMKLIELRTHWDVSRFISEVQPDITSTPAAIFYDKRIQSFVFFSDGIPVIDNSVIQWTPEGYNIDDYRG